MSFKRILSLVLVCSLLLVPLCPEASAAEVEYIFEPSDLSFFLMEDGGVTYQVSTAPVSSVDFELLNSVVAGDMELSIVVDGVSYIPIGCVFKPDQYYFFGNVSFFAPDEPDTGEPYLFVIYPDQAEFTILFEPDFLSGTHEIAIVAEPPEPAPGFTGITDSFAGVLDVLGDFLDQMLNDEEALSALAPLLLIPAAISIVIYGIKVMKGEW